MLWTLGGAAALVLGVLYAGRIARRRRAEPDEPPEEQPGDQ